MDLEKTGHFLQITRKKLNLTQEQLAEKLGVSQKSISRWETGKNLPDITTLQELCRALNINIAELINGERYEGDTVEKRKISSAAEGITFLFQKKRSVFHLIGAIVSLVVTTCCMLWLYHQEFSVTVDSTDALEEAVEGYCFNSLFDVNILESTSVGNRLVVLYDRIDAMPGTSGVAILEKGIFGKYRFNVCYDRRSFGIYSFQEELNGEDYLIVACADALPDFVSAYGILGYDKAKADPDYGNPEVIYASQYLREPFLSVVGLRKGLATAYQTVYYDQAQNEYDIFRIEDAVGLAHEGEEGVTTGSMEQELIFWREGVIFVLGLSCTLYFLCGIRGTKRKARRSSSAIEERTDRPDPDNA